MLVVAEHVRVGYQHDRDVLHDVNLCIGAGLHVVRGANGSGKTTLFRVLAGIIPPTAGRVLIAGQDPAQCPAIKGKVGYAPHRPALYPDLTVAENLLFWAKTRGLSAEAGKSSVSRAARAAGTEDLLGRRADELSRGQAQRASLSRALLFEPDVLLLDEPSTGLDIDARHQIWTAVSALASAGVSVLYATHSDSEVDNMVQSLIVVASGLVRQTAQPPIDPSDVTAGQDVGARP